MKVQKSSCQRGFVGLSAPAFPAIRRTIRTVIGLAIRPEMLRLIVPCALSAMLSGVLLAQTQAASPSSAARPSYIVPTLVPSNVRDALIALGDRIQKPGKERLTLIGKHTDKAGAVTAAQLIWEVPGRLRYDRAGAPPLVFDDVSGLVNAAAVSDADLGALESLLQDSPEAFFYGFVQGHANRFLGARYRADNGKAPNYTGPWFDIYDTFAPVQAISTIPKQFKRVFFDSVSGFLVKTQYRPVRAGTTISVSTEYSKWTVADGQATPGQIIRKENGIAVFTFDITSARVSPAVNDASFPNH